MISFLFCLFLYCLLATPVCGWKVRRSIKNKKNQIMFQFDPDRYHFNLDQNPACLNWISVRIDTEKSKSQSNDVGVTAPSLVEHHCRYSVFSGFKQSCVVYFLFCVCVCWGWGGSPRRHLLSVMWPKFRHWTTEQAPHEVHTDGLSTSPGLVLTDTSMLNISRLCWDHMTIDRSHSYMMKLSVWTNGWTQGFLLRQNIVLII